MGCGASSSPAPPVQAADPSKTGVNPLPSGAAASQADAAADQSVCEAQPATESGGSLTAPAATDAQSEAAPHIATELPESSTAPAPPTEVPDIRAPLFSEGSHVSISGIEKRPELNGQTGVIISYDGGADRRYTVQVLGSSLRLRESKLAATAPPTPDAESCERQLPEEETHDASSTSPTKPPRSTPQKFADFTYVVVSGIEKKPELNGQVGLVVSFDAGADRRYTVKIADSLVSLRECKLVAAPTPKHAQATSQPGAKSGEETAGAFEIASTMADEELDRVLSECRESGPESGKAESPSARDIQIAAATQAMDAKIQALETYPMAELTAKGALIPTYEWQKVPQVASLPPGLEVWMPMNHTKCARIPATWRLQVVAEGQIDSYRCDVGEHTPLTEILEGAVTAFGWDGNVVRLCANGVPLDFGEEDTVGSASLFGQKMTARKSIT